MINSEKLQEIYNDICDILGDPDQYDFGHNELVLVDIKVRELIDGE